SRDAPRFRPRAAQLSRRELGQARAARRARGAAREDERLRARRPDRADALSRDRRVVRAAQARARAPMTAILHAVGDVAPDRDDPNECFALAAATLRGADIGFCQLECNL